MEIQLQDGFVRQPRVLALDADQCLIIDVSVIVSMLATDALAERASGTRHDPSEADRFRRNGGRRGPRCPSLPEV